MQCVIEHGVERHPPYVVCLENGGCGARYSHIAWCGASPAVCCGYVRRRVQCVIEHGVERHLPYHAL